MFLCDLFLFFLFLELTRLVVIGTDCNYNTIMTTTAPALSYTYSKNYNTSRSKVNYQIKILKFMTLLQSGLVMVVALVRDRSAVRVTGTCLTDH
jgi:phosphate starvation-inducible membrane PsiE